MIFKLRKHTSSGNLNTQGCCLTEKVKTYQNVRFGEG